MKNKIQPLGKIRRTGNRYCGSGCGLGCTWAEYQSAISEAKKLVKRMGKGWTWRVWENLGWHYMAYSPNGYIYLSPPSYGGKTYSAMLLYEPFESGGVSNGCNAKTPEAAVKGACEEARARLREEKKRCTNLPM